TLNTTRNQFPLLGESFTIKTASNTYNEVLSDVGANRYIDDIGNVQFYLDEYDNTKINNVLNGISGYIYDEATFRPSNWPLPKLPENKRPTNYDTDKDGMADAWEIRQFGNLSKSPGGHDISPNYTNIEAFLYQVDF